VFADARDDGVQNRAVDGLWEENAPLVHLSCGICDRLEAAGLLIEGLVGRIEAPERPKVILDAALIIFWR
jgi:hypothetical protein